MFPSKVSGLKSQSNISYFAHEHILLFSTLITGFSPPVTTAFSVVLPKRY